MKMFLKMCTVVFFMVAFTVNGMFNTVFAVPRVKWTPEEDKYLLEVIKSNGYGDDINKINWKIIAGFMGKRTIRQCRERYQFYLAPTINNEPWTHQEDEELIRLVQLNGMRWARIAPYFNGRTSVSLKNRYNSICRNQKKDLYKNINETKKICSKETENVFDDVFWERYRLNLEEIFNDLTLMPDFFDDQDL